MLQETKRVGYEDHMYHKYTLSLLNGHEFATFNEACNHQNWIKAMHKITLGTFFIPSSVKLIGSKW
jgi:hypothetical protein